MPEFTSPPPASLRKVLIPDLDSSIHLPKRRNQSPSASLTSLPYRPNPSLSTLFAATASPSSIRSGSSTPGAESTIGNSTLLSGDGRSVSPVTAAAAGSPEVKELILRGVAPHVAVLASADTDSLCRDRGFPGGFLELVRPFGERVSGRVIVRDGSGVNRAWDDFGVRFVGIRDALGPSRTPGSTRPSFESRSSEANGSIGSSKSRPSYDGRRTGGDISQIEEVVDRHLSFAELRPPYEADDIMSPMEAGGVDQISEAATSTISPFYTLYLRRLLSGLPLSPHESFSHPVACIIAISSRNPSPIEEFKRLYVSTNTGDNQFPIWVNNDYLRYYVLVHDEDHDDIGKSTTLYEQMKRNFGLHCHLLRIRSTQCVPSDDDSIRLPSIEWMAAAEELAAIQKRETSDDLEDPTPYLSETDATALRTFVRELVTQSIVPGMERLCAQWNEQVANRRRGISGRFMSITKRFSPFGISRTASSPTAGLPNSSSNYDSLQGFYRPDTPEALMRKLADYAFMLRDFKLASSTYDLLRSDFEHDKAWKHYAGANEMVLLSTLLNPASRTRHDSIERWLEAACHSYIHRCQSPYYALRTLLLGAECLALRGSLAVDEPAAWAARTISMGLPGPVGGALVTERVAAIFGMKRGLGALGTGSRRRKRGFWSLSAAEAWIGLGKNVQAERCLDDARIAHGLNDASDKGTRWMNEYVQSLHEDIVSAKLEAMGFDSPHDGLHGEVDDVVEEEVVEEFTSKPHRRSIMQPRQDGGDTISISPMRSREDKPPADDGFEKS